MPKIPIAASLNAITNTKLGHQDVTKDLEDSNESDMEEESGRGSRAKRHSKGMKKREFTQLQDYLANWKIVLDKEKKIT